MRDTEATTLAGLRHRLGALERVELDASLERMVEIILKSTRATFGPQCSLDFSLNLRMSGEAFMGETGIRVSLESEGEVFSRPVDKTTPDGQRPPTPDRLGGNYIIGEKPK